MISHVPSAVALVLIFIPLIIFFRRQDHRAEAIVTSFFLYSFSIDVAIQIEPPKLIAIISTITLFLSTRKIPATAQQLAFYSLTFLAYTLLIWVVGLNLVPEISTGSWARGSTGKPVIQLASLCIFTAFIAIAAGSFKEQARYQRFFNFWAKCAILSSFVCVLQSFSPVLFGRPLFGIIRGTTGMDYAYMELLGLSLHRATAFGGEPKQQGMSLCISLAMLTSANAYGYWKCQRNKYRWTIAVVLFSIVLTGSSGAYIFLGAYAACILLTSSLGSKSNILLVVVLIIGVGTVSGASTYVAERTTGRITLLFENVRLRNTNSADMGDKELPAMVFLLENPLLALFGTGLGTSPYYFEPLIESRRHVGLYLEPNGGIIWAVYSFGIIGIAFGTAGIIFFVKRSFPKNTNRGNFGRRILLIIAISLIPLHLIWWVCFLLGVFASLSVDCVGSRVVSSRVTRPKKLRRTGK